MGTEMPTGRGLQITIMIENRVGKGKLKEQMKKEEKWKEKRKGKYFEGIFSIGKKYFIFLRTNSVWNRRGMWLHEFHFLGANCNVELKQIENLWQAIKIKRRKKKYL